MRTVGGFGSAGAGNRTGRHTMTRGGLSTTARERNRRVEHAPSAGVDMPTRDELAEAIRVGRCWWCGADKGHEGRPFQSIAGHWRWAHDISAQVARDILQVPKCTSFVTDELKLRLSDEAKRRYNPEVLHVNYGRKRQLTAFGLASQRKKIAVAQAVVAAKFKGDQEFRERFAAAVSMGQGGKSITVKTCVVCQVLFDVETREANRHTTCGSECRSELRRRRMTGRVVSEETRKKMSESKSKGDVASECAVCSAAFIVPRRLKNRATCGRKDCVDALRLRNGAITEDGRRRISEASKSRMTTHDPR